MNKLKELIKETECDLHIIDNSPFQIRVKEAKIRLKVRKQTIEADSDYIEAFDRELDMGLLISHGWKSSKEWSERFKDRQKLKKLLDNKEQ